MREGDISGHSIVLIGRFNPAILQPAWLEAVGLLEGRDLQVHDQLIVPPLTALNFGWMSLEVTEDRAAFSVLEEATSPAPLRDFVVDLFRILEHTPVFSLGMNHTLHFALRNGWQMVSAAAVPGGALEARFPDATLRSATWTLPRPDGLRGAVYLKLEPSQRLPDGGWAEWNSHVDLAPPTTVTGARPAIEALELHWDNDRRSAAATFDYIRDLP